MSEKGDFLKSIPIFSALYDTDIESIASSLEEFNYKNGEYIFYEGDSPDWLCIVKEGNVKAIKYHEDGKEIILHVFMPGDIFGELAVLDRRPYPASAQAMGQTMILKLGYERCRKLCEKFPELRSQLIQSMGEKQRGFLDRLEATMTTRVEKRIADTLIRLASSDNSMDGMTIKLHLTRKDIANMVGTTIETTIRIMSKMQKAGIIESTREGITILRPDLLRVREEEHD